MGTNIKVDYNRIPTVLSSVKTTAHDLNSELTNMYRSVGDMHNSWHGVRYATLTNEFDKTVDNLNEILSLVVTEIPASLETIYNNYVAFENQTSPSGVSEEQPTKINPIATQADSYLDFNAAEVNNVHDMVKKNFANAVENMNSIDSQINSFTWESDSATEYKSRLKQLKSDITTAFDNISEVFTTQMQIALEESEKLEQANMGN